MERLRAQTRAGYQPPVGYGPGRAVGCRAGVTARWPPGSGPERPRAGGIRYVLNLQRGGNPVSEEIRCQCSFSRGGRAIMMHRHRISLRTSPLTPNFLRSDPVLEREGSQPPILALRCSSFRRRPPDRDRPPQSQGSAGGRGRRDPDRRDRSGDRQCDLPWHRDTAPVHVAGAARAAEGLTRCCEPYPAYRTSSATDLASY